MAAADPSDQRIGATVNEIAERASLLVREEIELAKAEVTQKLTSLAKAGGIALAAGVFVVAALIYLLHGVAFAFYDYKVVDQVAIGYFIVAAVLLLLAGVSGYLAYRWFSRGSPPTPDMAIDEARLIRETVSSSTEVRP
ncbi:MAG TPA: phage holin family protein [Solirubrobacteraceae bacterium]|nr:phage holin family protein [Solirubrobacteraceae bacterium]